MEHCDVLISTRCARLARAWPRGRAHPAPV